MLSAPKEEDKQRREKEREREREREKKKTRIKIKEEEYRNTEYIRIVRSKRFGSQEVKEKTLPPKLAVSEGRA